MGEPGCWIFYTFGQKIYFVLDFGIRQILLHPESVNVCILLFQQLAIVGPLTTLKLAFHGIP